MTLSHLCKLFKKTEKWMLKTVVSEHNHQKCLHSSGHSRHRKLTVDQLDKVKNMTDAVVKPTAILSALRMTKSDTFANLRTIYNGRVNMRNEQLAGRAPLEAFLDNLQESDWMHHVEANEVGNITGLFFAHPESIKLANH